MQLIRKIVIALVMPSKRRRFSRVDFILLLLLGVAFIVSLFIPSATAHAQRATPTQASNQAISGAAAKGRPPCPHGMQQTLKGCVTPPPTTPTTPAPTSALPVGSDCPLAGMMTVPTPNLTGKTVSSPLGNNDILFFFTDPGITIGNCAVQGFSNILTWFVNGFIAVIFVLVGLRIMLGGSVLRYASAVEMLPGILLAILAANLSLYIVGDAVTLNNSMTVAFYEEIGNMTPYTASLGPDGIVTKTCNHMDAVLGGLAGSFIPVLGSIAGAIIGENIGCNSDANKTVWQQTLQSALSPPNITGGLSPTGFMFLWHSISDLLQDITGTLALMLMGQIAMRLLFLDFYIATAPLGMGAWALPGRAGQALTRIWLQGFFTILFAQFVQVIALAIIRVLVGAITSDLYVAFSAGPIGSAVNGDSTLLWIIQIAQYWFLLRVPSLLIAGPAGSPVLMTMNYGQTVQQVVQSSAAATQAGLQFGLQALGGVAGAAMMGLMFLA